MLTHTHSCWKLYTKSIKAIVLFLSSICHILILSSRFCSPSEGFEVINTDVNSVFEVLTARMKVRIDKDQNFDRGVLSLRLEGHEPLSTRFHLNEHTHILATSLTNSLHVMSFI